MRTLSKSRSAALVERQLAQLDADSDYLREPVPVDTALFGAIYTQSGVFGDKTLTVCLIDPELSR